MAFARTQTQRAPPSRCTVLTTGAKPLNDVSRRFGASGACGLPEEVVSQRFCVSVACGLPEAEQYADGV